MRRYRREVAFEAVETTAFSGPRFGGASVNNLSRGSCGCGSHVPGRSGLSLVCSRSGPATPGAAQQCCRESPIQSYPDADI